MNSRTLLGGSALGPETFPALSPDPKAFQSRRRWLQMQGDDGFGWEAAEMNGDAGLVFPRAEYEQRLRAVRRQRAARRVGAPLEIIWAARGTRGL
jgi:hypothetical protein